MDQRMAHFTIYSTLAHQCCNYDYYFKSCKNTFMETKWRKTKQKLATIHHIFFPNSLKNRDDFGKIFHIRAWALDV